MTLVSERRENSLSRLRVSRALTSRRYPQVEGPHSFIAFTLPRGKLAMSSTFSGEGRHRALASVTGRAIRFSRLPSPPARLGSPVTLPRQRVLSWMTIRVGG